MDTSIRVIGQVTLANGSCRQVYERDGLQYVLDNDGQFVPETWLLVDEEEPGHPCDGPVIVYPEFTPAF
jgi:hypothetical protein